MVFLRTINGGLDRTILAPGERLSPAEIASKEAKGEAPLGLYSATGEFIRSPRVAATSPVALRKSNKGEPKVALAQLEVKAGMPERNVAEMLRLIKEAKADGADIVVFPEMCVGGYLLGDEWKSDANCRDLMTYNDAIRRASKGITVAWGNVCLDTAEDMAKRGVVGFHPNKDGSARRYNAIYVANDGKWARRKKPQAFLPPGVQAKTLLPNYGVFDDERYFFSLDDVAKDFGTKLEDLQQPFIVGKGKDAREIGFINCEDMWIKNYRMNNQPLSVARMLVDNGAERVIDMSSSPWAPGKEEARDAAVRDVANDLGDRMVPLYYCAHTGEMNNGKNFIGFDGGSSVYNAKGERVAGIDGMYETGLLTVKNVAEAAPIERKTPTAMAQKVETIIRGIRHLRDSAGFSKHPNFVIGVSGGVDSALSAALLKLAMKDQPDAGRIIALNLPTKFNSAKTKNAAKQLADKLGLEYHVVPIEAPVAEIKKAVESIPLFDGETKAMDDMPFGNLMAKVRGTDIQSNVAQHVGGVFVNNGNKLEVALGYATLYGDWGGAMSVLGDLTKEEVFAMAHYLNVEVFGDEVIPETLLPDELFRFGADKIKPTAELEHDQEDPMKFGYHCRILEAMTSNGRAAPEDFLRWWQQGVLHEKLGISVELMQRYGVDDAKTFVEDLSWFTSTISKQKFKRVQAPPIILVSSAGYGADIRESLVPHRETKAEVALKKQILEAAEPYGPARQVAA